MIIVRRVYFLFMHEEAFSNFLIREAIFSVNYEKFNESIIYVIILIKRNLFISMCDGDGGILFLDGGGGRSDEAILLKKKE